MISVTPLNIKRAVNHPEVVSAPSVKPYSLDDLFAPQVAENKTTVSVPRRCNFKFTRHYRKRFASIIHMRVCMRVSGGVQCEHTYTPACAQCLCYLCSLTANPRINNWSQAFMIASEWPRSVTQHHVITPCTHTHTRFCIWL